MKTKQKSDWESIIRQAVKESGLTLRALEHLTGISNAQLSRFMTGKRSLTLRPTEKLSKALGLELRKRG